MSKNLVELVRRHHGESAPTALEVLKEALERNGEITDDDRREAAERSGLPEATVYGVSTFYDDLLQPRGARHVRVCTGTACFAATGDEHVDRIREGLGLELGERSDDGSVSLAETVCLGFCHSSPAVRDGDVIDAGPGVVERVLAGECAQAAEPEWRSVLDEPVLTRPGDWSGLRRALEELTPEELLEEVKEADVRGRGGAGFPAGRKWEFARAAEGDEKFIVANGDEGDPGSYIDKYLMERSPALLLEGMALAGYAVGAEHGFVLTRSEYPLLEARARGGGAPRSRGGLARHRDRRDRLRLRRDRDRGRRLLRRRRGDGAARLPAGAARHGLRPPAVPGPARPPRPADRRQQRRDALQHALHRAARAPTPTARSAPVATPGTKLVCFNERFARPGVYEVPFGMPVARAVRGARRRAP